MMAKLRVVTPGVDSAPQELSMAEALEGLVKECLADEPAALLLAWESKGKINCRCLPASVMVQKGFVYTMHEIVFETEEGIEE